MCVGAEPHAQRSVLVLEELDRGHVVLIASRSSADDYRVDVIFDNSRGLTPGQLVEVAGARVGTMTAMLVSAVGTGAGLYLGWWAAERLLD